MDNKVYKEMLRFIDYYQQMLHTIIKKQAFGDRLAADELNVFRNIINEKQILERVDND